MEVVEYDQFSAAKEHIELAIAALQAGAWGAAITLAGAAEGALPKVSGPTAYEIYTKLVEEAGVQLDGDASRSNPLHPNYARNRLKHGNWPAPRIFVQGQEACFATLRAVHRLQLAFPSRDHGETINSFAKAIAEDTSDSYMAPKPVAMSFHGASEDDTPRPMELDNPTVIAEARAVFDRYEDALMNNRTEVLNEIFWADPRTVRFGITEILYGIEAIRGFRASVKAYAQRVQRKVHITSFGQDFACTHLEYERVGTGLIGRETKIMVRLPEIGWRVVSAHVSLLAGQDPGRA